MQNYLIDQIKNHSLDYSFLQEDSRIQETIAKADKAYKAIQEKNKLNQVDANDNQVMLVYLRELFAALYVEKKLQEKDTEKTKKDNKGSQKNEKDFSLSLSVDIEDFINNSFFANKEIKCFKAPYWMDNQRGIDLILCTKARDQVIVSLLDTKFRIPGAISEVPSSRKIFNDQRKVIEKLVKENYYKDLLVVVPDQTKVVTMDSKKVSDFAKNIIV